MYRPIEFIFTEIDYCPLPVLENKSTFIFLVLIL